MKLSVPPKLVEKLAWVPVISCCKIFISSFAFDGLSCQNWPFLPPNSLRITLMPRDTLDPSYVCFGLVMASVYY
jgi:hypothetical protein